jgi:hypothetical protein
MLRLAIRGAADAAREVRFCVHVRNDNRGRTPPLGRLTAVCGPDSDGRPCLTILLLDEG